MFKVEIWTDEQDFWLTDQPDKMGEWATSNCPSYTKYEFLDMSDFSWDGPDSGVVFHFKKQEDALLFQLKFQR